MLAISRLIFDTCIAANQWRLELTFALNSNKQADHLKLADSDVLLSI